MLKCDEQMDQQEWLGRGFDVQVKVKRKVRHKKSLRHNQ
jgi:hypothetical protein